MLLEDLTRVIESLRERIHSHGGALRENETRTRMALVDPLLQALGWDVSDPAIVTPEYKGTSGSADYALQRSKGQPAATVEAKKLGEPLDSHRMQMLNYANASGIDFAALTDGNHWELYDVFRRGTLVERRKLDVSIARDPVHEVALKLLLLWRPNLTSGRPVHAGEPIVAAEPSTTPRPEAEQAAAPRPESPDWVPLFGFEESPYAGSRCLPAAIRFWDGSVRRVRHWTEVPTVTVKKLCSEKMLTEGDMPVLSKNGKKHLVSTEPVHPNGEQFRGARSIDGETPLFVFVHGSSKALIGRTRRLLRLYGPESPEVHLQIKE